MEFYAKDVPRASPKRPFGVFSQRNMDSGCKIWCLGGTSNGITTAIFSGVMENKKTFIFSESRGRGLFKKFNEIKIASRSAKF